MVEDDVALRLRESLARDEDDLVREAVLGLRSNDRSAPRTSKITDRPGLERISW